MKHTGFPCLSVNGLDLLLHNFIDDERIKQVLAHSFSSCGVARYPRFQSDPGHIFQFRRGGKLAPGALVVLLWGEESEVAYYGGSHQHNLVGVPASNSLWEVPAIALERVGCNRSAPISFNLGGLTIQNARVALEIRKGQPISCVFATHKTMARWSKIILPSNPEILAKIAAASTGELDILVHLMTLNGMDVVLNPVGAMVSMRVFWFKHGCIKNICRNRDLAKKKIRCEYVR
ncbi:hypothetical protein F4824DRAFT_507921 [Ustulina deusta]|nr:hypothetical protein F4824DRAFT_507921 [Ustulina deusta]